MVAKQAVKTNKILPPSPILCNSLDDKQVIYLIWPNNYSPWYKLCRNSEATCNGEIHV